MRATAPRSSGEAMIATLTGHPASRARRVISSTARAEPSEGEGL